MAGNGRFPQIYVDSTPYGAPFIQVEGSGDLSALRVLVEGLKTTTATG